MPRKKHNELLAGTFVLLALALVLGLILWIGGVDLLATKGQVAVFYVPAEQGGVGLAPGVEVSYGDSPIGKVKSVEARPDLGKCFYYVQLDRKDISIFSDGKAIVSSPPIGSPRLMVMSTGASGVLATADNPVLIGGGLERMMSDVAVAVQNVRSISDKLVAEMDPADSAKLLGQTHAILRDLKKASAVVAVVAGLAQSQADASNPQSMVAKVHRSIDDVNDITADAKPKVAAALGGVQEIVADAKPKVAKMLLAAQETADAVEGYAKNDVAEILLKLRQANTLILKVTEDFADVSKEARNLVATNRESVDTMIDNLMQVSANLQATAKEVRRNPWRLLYRPSEKETRQQDIHEAARAFSEGATQLDRAATKLSGLIKAHPQGVGADDKLVEQILKDLKGTFGRFSKIEQNLWNELEKP